MTNLAEGESSGILMTNHHQIVRGQGELLMVPLHYRFSPWPRGENEKGRQALRKNLHQAGDYRLLYFLRGDSRRWIQI